METYTPDQNGNPTIQKTTKAVLDYSFDWSKWLKPVADTITSYAVEAQPGITVDSHMVAGDVVTVWLSGGTAGNTYPVRCKITTDAGRTEERMIRVAMVAGK